MENLDLYLIKNIKSFVQLDDLKQKQFLLFILYICKIELETIKYNLVENKVEFDSFFVKDIINEYFDNKLIKHVFDNLIETKEYFSNTFKILDDVISLIDQLPHENLIEDSFDERNELLKRIEAETNIIIGYFK